MSKSWANGSTRKWREIRARVLQANLENNGGRCRLQIEGVCTGIANSVHHTKSRKIVGDDPVFLMAVCMKCNTHVGSPDNKNKNTHKPVSQPHNRVSSWKLPKTSGS